jgi:hypothetical protein
MRDTKRLMVTAGFDANGENIAIMLHDGTPEGQAKAERVIDNKAKEQGKRVSRMETMRAARWLATDVCQCVRVGCES